MKDNHRNGFPLALVTIPLLLLLVSCAAALEPFVLSEAVSVATPNRGTMPSPDSSGPAAQSSTEPIRPSARLGPTATVVPLTATATRIEAPTAALDPTDPPAPTATGTPEPEEVAHTVQPGESLLQLAQSYSVPIAAIQLENNLGERISIQAGQVLTIPAASEWSSASCFWLLYVVEAGDTLTGIAAEHNLEVNAIQEANNLSDTEQLAIDQELILPFAGPEGVLALAPPPPTLAPRSEPGSAAAPLPPAAPAAPVAGWPGEVLQQINAVRASYGLYALSYSAELAAAAQYHAQDCANRGWCSHTGSDGSNSLTRMLRAGFPATRSSECWVHARSPQQAVEWWLNEVPPNDPHRRTLLSTYLTHVGIGVVESSWGYYFVADFGATG